MSALPSGTVTFLFTDIEGSTSMLRTLGHERYVAALTVHDAILRDAIMGAGGHEVSTEGDAFFAAFGSAKSAVDATVRAQQRLNGHDSLADAPIRVRMGLHTGDGILRGDDYVGLDVHRAARVAAAGHGGQVLLSAATARMLRDDLPPGVEIMDLGRHVLKDLDAERLWQLRVPGLASEFPPLRTLRATVVNLQLELTSFVGREHLVEEIGALLETRRLVTLTGPGGTGKTRLAAAAAAAIVGRFGDGAVFVPLAGIADPESIHSAVIDALGLRSTSSATSPSEQLLSFLAQRELLLVLDNFEHLLAGSPKVSEILQAAPDVRVLATSRAPLRVRGEREIAVVPLSTAKRGDDSSEAARLFIDRAADVRPDLELRSTDVEAIETLVRRLDGLPLAIELAASKVKMLEPSAILDRLENRLLSDTGSDLPARQRTISDAIEWSYDLLADWPKRVLARCSVFSGAARLEELEIVCEATSDDDGDVLDALTELVDHNLLYRSTGMDGVRFGMLTVIREFAAQRVADRGEESRLRQRHVRAYRQLVAEAEPKLMTSDRRFWLDRLARDHDDIRSALSYASEVGDAESALAVGAGMWRFWQTRGPLAEAAIRVGEALAIDGETEPAIRAKALRAQGGIAYWRGEFDAMREPYEEAVRLLRASGPTTELAGALYDLSFAYAGTGQHEVADTVLAESMSISQVRADEYGIARAHWGMFDNAWYRGDTGSARHFAGLAVDGFEKLDAPFDLGWARFALADSMHRLGQLDEAKAQLDLAVGDFLDAGDLTALVLYLDLYAGLALDAGDRDRAARLVGAAERLREQTGMRLSQAPKWRETNRETLELLGSIDDHTSAQLEEGRRMDAAHAVEHAVSP